MPNQKIITEEIFHEDEIPNNSADLSNCKSLSVDFNEKKSSPLSEALAKDAMEPNYNKETKKQRTKRTFCTLEASEELNMLEFIHENQIIWNIK